MKIIFQFVIITVCAVLAPCLLQAQSLAEEVNGLHSVLEELYDEMIPLCADLISVARGLAGFGAIWYIGSRVWKHIANAEPIDFYPLFRPFVLGFCIGIFPLVLGMINGVMKPIVSSTQQMVENSDETVARLLKEKEEAIKKTDKWLMYVGPNDKGDYAKWYSYTHDGEDVSSEGFFAGIGNSVKFAVSKAMYNLRNSIKELLSQVLQLLFAAAALCINTIRTFNMIILAILGPLVFGLAVFDGFQHTLRHWLAKYINVFLWLPVANIFGAIIGKIQENMLELDLEQIGQNGDTFFSAKDMAYMIFMIIGIVGYFTVPSVANSIIQAGGGGMLTSRVNTLATSSTNAISQRVQQSMSHTNTSGNYYTSGYAGNNEGMSAGYGPSQAGDYNKKKLSGNS